MSYLFNSSEILQTIDMINQQHLDVRTITMGISLLDCASESMDECCRKIYDKICRCAGKLVETGCAIERELGIPVIPCAARQGKGLPELEAAIRRAAAGENETHLCFTASDYEAAHEKHRQMGCICYENTKMGLYFIEDPDGYWIEIVRPKH